MFSKTAWRVTCQNCAGGKAISMKCQSIEVRKDVCILVRQRTIKENVKMHGWRKFRTHVTEVVRTQSPNLRWGSLELQGIIRGYTIICARWLYCASPVSVGYLFGGWLFPIPVAYPCWFVGGAPTVVSLLLGDQSTLANYFSLAIGTSVIFDPCPRFTFVGTLIYSRDGSPLLHGHASGTPKLDPKHILRSQTTMMLQVGKLWGKKLKFLECLFSRESTRKSTCGSMDFVHRLHRSRVGTVCHQHWWIPNTSPIV